MKNLANCKPREFLRQTNLIRKSVEKWLDVTNIMDIRRRKPDLSIYSEDDFDGRTKAMEEQARKNVKDMLDMMLDKHPDETLEILALMCFVEPNDIDNYTVAEYLDSFTELISNKSVLRFFTSLVRLEQMPTSDATKA